MSTSSIEIREAQAQTVVISEETLAVDLTDGRSIAVPLAWFPRLAYGTSAERSRWRLIAGGEGIHWPDLDEDISIASLLVGRKSDETRESLQRWLQSRQQHPGT